MKFTLLEIIAEMRREMKFTKTVYGGKLSNQRITQAEYDKRVGIISQVLSEYESRNIIAEEQTLFGTEAITGEREGFKFYTWLLSHGWALQEKISNAHYRFSDGITTIDMNYHLPDESKLFGGGWFMCIEAKGRLPMTNIPCPANEAQAFMIVGYGELVSHK